MDTLRIIQRFHHLFYTPQFVVMHLGVLEQEGLRVELTTATSAAELNDKLLTGEADLGLGGPIRTLELAEHHSPGTLIASGQAALVAAEGEVTGALPFSAFLITPAFMTSHAELLRRFTRAFYRAQQWLAQHSAEDLSELIAPSFPDIEPALRTRILT